MRTRPSVSLYQQQGGAQSAQAWLPGQESGRFCATTLLAAGGLLWASFYSYSKNFLMGSGSGSDGIRWSRYLPRARLTATRHRFSKALGTPGMRGRKGGGGKEVNFFPNSGRKAAVADRNTCSHAHRHCPNFGERRAGKAGPVIHSIRLQKERNPHDLRHLLSVTAPPQLLNSLNSELAMTTKSPAGVNDRLALCQPPGVWERRAEEGRCQFCSWSDTPSQVPAL